MNFDTQQKVLVEGAEITFLPEGIVHIHYISGNTFDKPQCKKIFDTTTELTKLKKVRILLTGGDFVTHDAEATKYNASPEVMNRCAAVAMVTQNLAERILGNFFMNFYRPAAPLKLFANVEEAKKWLLRYNNVEFNRA